MSIVWITDTESVWEDDDLYDPYYDDPDPCDDRSDDHDEDFDDDDYVLSRANRHKCIIYYYCDDCGKLEYETGSGVLMDNNNLPLWYDYDVCKCLPF